MVMKVTTLGGAPQRRPNMEPRETHQKNPPVRKLTTPRNLLVEKLTHSLKGKERSEIITKVVILMERLRKGKRQKLRLLF